MRFKLVSYVYRCTENKKKDLKMLVPIFKTLEWPMPLEHTNWLIFPKSHAQKNL